MLRWCVFLLVCGASAAQRVAVAQLSSAQVSGAVVFTEVARGVRVAGSFTGALANGYYGLHVHEAGDVSSCAAAGAHFDPHGVTHGGPDHAVRHVGDMGNVAFNAGVGVVDYVDAVLTLRGANSVLGRAVVFHEGEDDLGLRGDAGSLATGNAGGRLACGVVGLASPLEPWDSAAAAHAALGPLILLALAFAAFIR